MSVKRRSSARLPITLAALVAACLLAACQNAAPREARERIWTTSPVTTSLSAPAPAPAPKVSTLSAAPRADQEPQGAQPAPQASGGSHPDEWEFHAGLYMWGAGMEGVATAGPVGVPINESFSDVVDNLRFAAMLAFEGKKEQWGLRLDSMYLDLGGSTAGMTGTIDTEIQALVAEADVLFSPLRAPSLDFIAGVRVLSIETEVDFPIAPTVSGDTTMIDPIIGAQGTWDLADAWKFRLRGDVGGFGASSELTYQFLGFFRWAFAESWGLDFGYRLLGYDINDSDVSLDAQFHGLVVGVDFAF